MKKKTTIDENFAGLTFTNGRYKYEGDLKINGDVVVSIDLVVSGDVVVEGNLTCYQNITADSIIAVNVDGVDVTAENIKVSGSITAENVVGRNVAVGGTILAGNVKVGRCYCDQLRCVNLVADAPIHVSGDLEITGKIYAPLPAYFA